MNRVIGGIESLLYPALDVVSADGDLVLAVVDDYSPTAVEERDGFLTIFFSDRVRRDNARDAIANAWPLTRHHAARGRRRRLGAPIAAEPEARHRRPSITLFA